MARRDLNRYQKVYPLTRRVPRFSGSISNETQAISGVFSQKSMAFDGNHYVVISGTTNDFDFTDRFTFVAWVKPNSGSLSDARGIASRWNDVGTQWAIGNFTSSSQSVAFALAAADGGSVSSPAAVTSASILDNDIWSHIACIYSGGGVTEADRVKIYHNGVEQVLSFSGTIQATLNQVTSSVHLGFVGTGSILNWNGNLDEVGLYSEALSAAEISDIYNSGSTVSLKELSTVTELVAYYTLGDDPSDIGTNVEDSQFLNDGTVINFTGSNVFFTTQVPTPA